MFIRKSVFDKSVFRSICKILFLLVEIFSLVFISLFVEDNLSGHDEFWEFLEYLSGMIIVIYIISIPIILAVSIFNFLHQFNDYDSVRDCLFSLLYAPAALIFHTFKHLLHTIAYLFGYEFPIERVHDTDYYTTSYTTPQSTGSSNTQKANTAAKTGHTSPIPDGKDISKFNDIINKKASAIAWNSRPAPLVPSGSEAYWEGGHLKVNVAPWGSITFYGKIIYKTTPDDMHTYFTSDFEDGSNATIANLRSEMQNAINEASRSCNGYSKQYTLYFDISYSAYGFKTY